MTKDEIIRQTTCFAVRVKNLAQSMEHEGHAYDMKWHYSYCKRLVELSEELLNMVK